MRIGIYLENYDVSGVESVICNTINTWPNQTDEFIIVVNRDNDGIDFLRRNIGNRICTIIIAMS